MELTYVLCESAIKQPELEIGVTTVYLRRNFTQVEHQIDTEGEDYELIWLYEEASLSKDEALYYLTEQNKELSEIVGVDTKSSTDQIWVAAKYYDPGDYITANGALYKVILPIVSGSRITIGTNVESTEIMYEIANFSRRESNTI